MKRGWRYWINPDRWLAPAMGLSLLIFSLITWLQHFFSAP